MTVPSKTQHLLIINAVFSKDDSCFIKELRTKRGEGQTSNKEFPSKRWSVVINRLLNKTDNNGTKVRQWQSFVIQSILNHVKRFKTLKDKTLAKKHNNEVIGA